MGGNVITTAVGVVAETVTGAVASKFAAVAPLPIALVKYAVAVAGDPLVLWTVTVALIPEYVAPAA
jgi:hypothetical protein